MIQLINSANTTQLAQIIKQQTLNDYKNPKRLYFIRKVTLNIVSRCKEKDYLCECNKIVNWVYNYFRYVRDPHGVELFISPYLLLLRALKDKKLAQADCETLAQLVAVMCMSIGHKAKILLIDTTGNGKVNHAINMIKPKFGRWYYADTTKYSYLLKTYPLPIYSKIEIDLEVY